MIKIFEWCNENAGVIAAAQTLTTIILSIIAVIVIHFSRLQYKREMKFYTGLFYDHTGAYKLEIYLYNSGNVPLNIKNIQVAREYEDGSTDVLELGSCDPKEMNCKGFLIPKMHDSCSILLQNCNANIEEVGTKIKIIILSEEKDFVQRISWAIG